MPFWLHPTLSPATGLYALPLTLVAASIAGLLPGLKVTRGIATRLRQAGPGGGGLRFGGIWTALIVVQVTVMTIVPVFPYGLQQDAAKTTHAENAGLPADQYLSV